MRMRWFRVSLCAACLAPGFGSPANRAAAQPCNDQLILAHNPIAGEMFGRSLAVHGTTLVVGAPGNVRGESPFPGRVFVFEWDDGEWHYEATLTSRDSRNGDSFGYSVAINNDLIAVGSPYAVDSRGVQMGAVFVFDRPHGGWRTTDRADQRLEPSGSELGQNFGVGLSISDEWIAVGSPHADFQQRDAGEVRTFSLRGDQWVERERFGSPEPLADEHFGFRLELQDDMLIIGAPNLESHTLPGSVHVYERDHHEESWDYLQTLNGGEDRQAGDHFGRSIAFRRSNTMEENWLVIGSTGDDPNGEHSGSAHLFHLVRAGEGEYGWMRAWVLAVGGGRVGDHFGFSCAIDANRLLVGALRASPGDLHNVGSAYLFNYGGNAPAFAMTIPVRADCPREGDELGASCAFFEPADGVVLGAPGIDPMGLIDAGAVLFTRDR